MMMLPHLFESPPYNAAFLQILRSVKFHPGVGKEKIRGL